ncbi:MAG: GPR endopeptidase [Oscillospiraceae bacterium]|nr:GPR endopeptidase [Oscillospiraceae bacterium]
MLTIRTDLAAEAHELWRESSEKTTQLSGVRARDGETMGFPVHRVEILDSAGERALGKPRGTYLTLDVTSFWRREADSFCRAAGAVAELLMPLIPENGTVLVAGIGNAQMTPDALGPRTLEHLLITRHLGKVLPDFRSVAAVGAGVLGTTGMEVAEWVRGVSQRVCPDAVILVDALAARSLERLCTTIQIADSGLVPGSGVGNHRMALSRDTLGVPVVSVGVPTVVDAATLASDLLRGGDAENISAAVKEQGSRLFVTPDSIDAKIRDLAKIIGYGINLALQPGLEIDDLSALLE